MAEKFILVSLKEEKTKKLSQAISNETCRSILNFLAEKEFATETSIAKELGLPISTVHYNMRALLKNNLVEVEEFHYSKKGREVNHYRIANKLIIIAPKESEKFYNKLKKLLPVFFIIGAAAVFVQMFSGKARFAAVKETEMVAEALPASEPNVLIWFLLGTALGVLMYFLFDLIRKKYKSKH